MPTVFILAGGLATRMHPLTSNYPKILLEVNGRPFIYHQLKLLAQNLNKNECECKRVVLLLGFKGELVESYIKDNQLDSLFSLNISYVYDGPQLLGTGGAVKRALEAQDDTFIVLYGDSYLDYNYDLILNEFTPASASASASASALALMTVYKNNNSFDSSNVLFKNGKIILYDKKNKVPEMEHIDWGFNLFRRLAFDEFPMKSKKFDLSDVFQHSLRMGRLQGYEVNKRFYEIGSHSGLEELNNLLAKGS
ncbi:MAG: NTP transferase domain-containing protein [Oligoflexia bacterium]|nr:NTP transferase domain-containing protein [Oligoflexia bacterium]